jgi:hypothetical protein
MRQSGARFRIAIAIAASAIAIAMITSCAGQQTPTEPAQVQGRHFTLRLVPGPSYKFISWASVFPVTIYPQVACWIETPQGDYVDTIYVTAKGARKNWVAAPPDGRPEALPVWFNLQKKRSAAADTVSGPTPAGATTRYSALAAALPGGTYIAKLEIHRSYNYNERYTRANSGVSGQPSLIYECAIVVGEGPAKATFKPIGTGSDDGSDGGIRSGLDGITTALKLLDSAEITYEEGTSQ